MNMIEILKKLNAIEIKIYEKKQNLDENQIYYPLLTNDLYEKLSKKYTKNKTSIENLFSNINIGISYILLENESLDREKKYLSNELKRAQKIKQSHLREIRYNRYKIQKLQEKLIKKDKFIK